MSKDKVKAFLVKLSGDSELQGKLRNAMGDREEYLNRAVELGSAMGLEFTAHDFRDVVKDLLPTADSDGELSDEELENVAGGFDQPLSFYEDNMKLMIAKFVPIASFDESS